MRSPKPRDESAIGLRVRLWHRELCDGGLRVRRGLGGCAHLVPLALVACLSLALLACAEGTDASTPDAAAPSPDAMGSTSDAGAGLGDTSGDISVSQDAEAPLDAEPLLDAEALLDTSEGETTADAAPAPPVVCEGAEVEAGVMWVSPYLQLATPTSMWLHWETEVGAESRVEWGTSGALDNVTCGEHRASWLDTSLHEVQLTGLTPDTRYDYRVKTGDLVSEVSSFVTPGDPALEGASRFIVVSDMQIDNGNPSVWREIVEEGIIPFTTAEHGGDVADAVDIVMIPGDLVDQGWDIGDWREDFFPMSSALSAQVPIYPVLGNHEGGTPFFFDYFRLPENGTATFLEHWWWHDQGNVRMIGLDSNSGFRMQVQLDWLDDVLQTTCNDPAIDFVFAQLHHPFKSELWIPGEVDYTGDVISRLETFSTTCDKPSIHFFGHTHGYSRGQSRDHRHLWVNAATAGGNIDYWGEYEQVDYDEFTVTTDDWGFVFVEVSAGDDPEFRLRRVSRGDENEPLDNVVTDDLTVRRINVPPTRPNAIPPAPSVSCAGLLTLAASPFEDLDGGEHDATHWQVSETCEDFEQPLVDDWVQRQNWYADVDVQAGDDLEDHTPEVAPANGALCMRVRYRDSGLAWSDWSDPVAFSVGGALLAEDLVANPGAEEGVDGWTLVEGVLESLTAQECDGGSPATGQRYFAVGGLCVESPYAEAHQVVPLESAWWSEIDASQVAVTFGATFSTWEGDDEPGVSLQFLGVEGEVLGESLAMTSHVTSWTPQTLSGPVPPQARMMRLAMSGTRMSGTDNDSYVDDVHLTLMTCTAP
jgi:hypothetical protein